MTRLDFLQTRKFNANNFTILKLHEAEAKYVQLKERNPGMEVWPGPTEETFKLLQEQWPTKGKKQEQRWASLRDSCDAFPMHLILIRTDTISRICKEKITPIAHVKIMEVAGRTDMCYIDDFLIKQQFRSQGYGRFFFDMLQQFMMEQLDMDCFGMSTFANTTGQSFFFHMGMNKQTERIPYVDVHEKKLLIKLNSFFSVAKNAMDRRSDARRTWLAKELIHYHLFGTDGYTERNVARESAKAKLEAEAEEKQVSSVYEKHSADVTGHGGVKKMVGMWGPGMAPPPMPEPKRPGMLRRMSQQLRRMSTTIFPIQGH